MQRLLRASEGLIILTGSDRVPDRSHEPDLSESGRTFSCASSCKNGHSKFISCVCVLKQSTVSNLFICCPCADGASLSWLTEAAGVNINELIYFKQTVGSVNASHAVGRETTSPYKTPRACWQACSALCHCRVTAEASEAPHTAAGQSSMSCSSWVLHNLGRLSRNTKVNCIEAVDPF